MTGVGSAPTSDDQGLRPAFAASRAHLGLVLLLFALAAVGWWWTAGAMSGQVHGTQVTWSVDMTDIPPVLKEHLILTYSGVLNGARDTIDGKWSLRSRLSGTDERGTFEAKRKS